MALQYAFIDQSALLFGEHFRSLFASFQGKKIKNHLADNLSYLADNNRWLIHSNKMLTPALYNIAPVIVATTNF
jgi:hypothetical protein